MVNVLVIAATQTELAGFFPLGFKHDGVNLVSAVLGVGKGASIKLSQMLSRFKFDFVLLVGSCGSDDFVSGTLVSPRRLLNSEGTAVINLEETDSRFHPIEDSGITLLPWSMSVEVANFMTKVAWPPNFSRSYGVVCDMESYSTGDVCKQQKVEFGILKIVVDGLGTEIKSINEYLSFELALYKERGSILKEITRDTVLHVCCNA